MGGSTIRGGSHAELGKKDVRLATHNLKTKSGMARWDVRKLATRQLIGNPKVGFDGGKMWPERGAQNGEAMHNECGQMG